MMERDGEWDGGMMGWEILGRFCEDDCDERYHDE